MKTTDTEKQYIEEISALSGIQKDMIKECWEFTLLHWVEQITKNPDAFQTLVIPFLGTVKVKYRNDTELSTGELETEVDAFVSLSDEFKKLVGTIHDEGDSVVLALLKKKIDNAILTSSVKFD